MKYPSPLRRRSMTRTSSLVQLVSVSLSLTIGAAASPGQTVADEEVEAQQKAQYQELDRYFDRQVNEADRQRARSWQRNFSSIEDYEKSVEPWRAKLFEMLGGNSYPNSPLRPQEQLIAEFPTHKAYRVWFTAHDGGGEGLAGDAREVTNIAALDRGLAACAISVRFNDLIPTMLASSPLPTAYLDAPEDYAFLNNHGRLFDDADVVSLICPRPV